MTREEIEEFLEERGVNADVNYDVFSMSWEVRGYIGGRALPVINMADVEPIDRFRYVLEDLLDSAGFKFARSVD